MIKIGLLTQAQAYQRDSSSQNDQERPERKKKKITQAYPTDNNDIPSDESNISLEVLEEAIDGFQRNVQAKENGIRAEVEKNAPGLRVVLLDLKGKKLREMSGKEFVRLHASESQETRSSGKILDQKL